VGSNPRLGLELLEDRQAPATLTVDSTADTGNAGDPWLSLREAIAIVNSPTLPSGLSDQILARIDGILHEGGTDTIVFDPSAVTMPITLSGTQLQLSLPDGTARVTIDGGSGVTIDGNSASRVFQIDSGVRAAFDHLTITHGWIAGFNNGGGIANAGTLSVSNSTLRGNSSDNSGGGISNSGSLSVTRSLLTDNSTLIGSSSVGGAVYNAGTLVVTDSTLSGNSASYGGGIENTGTATVSNCTLGSNSTFQGGGIRSTGTLTVTNATFTANSAGLGGGGLFNNHGVLTVRNSTFTGNSVSTSAGGGVLNNGRMTMSNCTISGNFSGSPGGGLLNSSTMSLWSTIVAGNRSNATAPDIYSIVSGTTSSSNLVGVGDSGLVGIVQGIDHNQVGTSTDPINPRFAPLGDYGGPTQTLPLLPDSPARNAGDPDSALPTDQRGLHRLVDDQIDIGAFQTQANPFRVTTLLDPGHRFGELSLREAVNLANLLPGAHTISFPRSLDGGAVVLTAGQLELSGGGGVQTIDGDSRFTIDGHGSTRLFQIDAGTQAVLRGFDLGNGQAVNGGAVFNQGNLTVANCTLWDNVADNGGAIYNQGTLTLRGSTLEFGGAGQGGGVFNAGVLIGFNSTFAYITAVTAGGAIYNAAGGTATLTSLTISRNSADTGGGIDVAAGTVLVRNSIVADNDTGDGNATSDIAGSVGSESSYDLIGTGGSGGLSNGSQHNHVGVADPGLTTPVFISPQTPVFGFTTDSPALAAGDPSLLDDPVLRLDQHGNVRSVVNIGAM
jgi:hypothetical protein